MKQYFTKKYLLLFALPILAIFGAIFYFSNNNFTTSTLNLNEKQQLDSVMSVLDQPTVIVDSANEKNIVIESSKMKPESKKKRDSIVIQQVASSLFRGKSFDEIYQIYESKVNDYLKSKDKKVLQEIADFSNDPLFNGCKKLDQFKKRFNGLEKKLNGNDTEVY